MQMFYYLKQKKKKKNSFKCFFLRNNIFCHDILQTLIKINQPWHQEFFLILACKETALGIYSHMENRREAHLH